MKFEDITGKRFSKLLVLSVSGSQAVVKCDCGTERTVRKYDVASGKLKSCGAHACRVRDLVGAKFCFLTVISLNEDKTAPNRESYWNCKCDCGNEIITTTGQLNSGKTKSCGCYKSTWISTKNSHPIKDRIEKELYSVYRVNAGKRGYEFDLSMEQFVSFLYQDCFYCGSPPTNTMTKNRVTGPESIKFNGVDRIDNKQGYIVDNCVPCCKLCNHAKNDLSKEDFLYLIRKIYQLHFIKDESWKIKK